MSDNLWPEFPAEDKPRGMGQILHDACAGIGEATRDTIRFQVKLYTDRDRVQRDGYLVVPGVGYQHLLFRVITGVAPFPATIVTPNGHEWPSIPDEATLRDILKRYFHSPEVREVVRNLLSAFADIPGPVR